MAEKMAERDDAQMYFVGHIPFVPHYDTPDVYVAPGGIEWTLAELQKLKAVLAPTYLWPRHWQEKRKKEQGIKSKSKRENASSDLLLDYMKKEGSPMSSTEISRELNWNVARVRDALNKLHDLGLIEQWGTRNSPIEPQRWIAK